MERLNSFESHRILQAFHFRIISLLNSLYLDCQYINIKHIITAKEIRNMQNKLSTYFEINFLAIRCRLIVVCALHPFVAIAKSPIGEIATLYEIFIPVVNLLVAMSGIGYQWKCIPSCHTVDIKLFYHTNYGFPVETSWLLSQEPPNDH